MSAFFLDNYKNRREREVNETREVRVKKSCFCTRKQGSQCETKAKGKILDVKQREREEFCLSREKKSTREEKRKILVSKTKNSKKKTPHFSLQLVASRWSGGGVSSLLLARTLCAVNIHSTRILTFQRREHFQREKEKRVRK